MTVLPGTTEPQSSLVRFAKAEGAAGDAQGWVVAVAGAGGRSPFLRLLNFCRYVV